MRVMWRSWATCKTNHLTHSLSHHKYFYIFGLLQASCGTGNLKTQLKLRKCLAYCRRVVSPSDAGSKTFAEELASKVALDSHSSDGKRQIYTELNEDRYCRHMFMVWLHPTMIWRHFRLMGQWQKSPTSNYKLPFSAFPAFYIYNCALGR